MGACVGVEPFAAQKKLKTRHAVLGHFGSAQRINGLTEDAQPCIKPLTNAQPHPGVSFASLAHLSLASLRDACVPSRSLSPPCILIPFRTVVHEIAPYN